ncbi:MAG: hypothetical protein K0S47_4031 [Herbinix sp.]|jgi:hypothetical protein|nr:hypothetical protein [Herbinix sp.]
MISDIKNYLKNVKMKSEFILGLFFQIMIFSSFWGSVLLPITVPGIGEMFLFRIMIFITSILFVLHLVINKVNPFKGKNKLEYMVFILITIMILYGILSLARAIDIAFTFRRLFNLCIDVTFLLLLILYINDRMKINITLFNCIINMIILSLLGIYEAFHGGIFYDKYDIYQRFPLFDVGYIQFPTVSFNNTNDFSCTLLFYLPFVIAFLLTHINKNNKYKKLYIVLLSLTTSLSYFIVKLASARLAMISVYIIIISLFAYIIIFKRKLWSIIVLCSMCFAFIFVMENYKQLKADTINIANNIKYKYEKMTSDEVIEKPETYTIPTKETLSLKEQLIVVDEETNEVTLNTEASVGTRVALLRFSIKTFIKSYGFGVGLGNTEQMAKAVAVEQLGGMWSMHCFAARFLADMGILVLLPIIIIVLFIIKLLFKLVRSNNIKDSSVMIPILFTVVSIICFPLLSTSPSDAQDILGMWFCIAAIIITIIKVPSLLNQSNLE